MKNFLFTLAFLTLILGTAKSTEIQILHVNDTHSNMCNLAPRDKDGNGTVGGAARAASKIMELRNENTILVHPGDFSIGDLFFNQYYAVPEILFMKSMKFDAVGLGNHEFDLYPETLLASMQYASSMDPTEINFLSSNMFIDTSKANIASLNAFVKPYIIKTIDGIKVGIFSITSPKTNLLSNPGDVIISDKLEEIIPQILTELKTAGCDVIVFLSGLGLKNEIDIAKSIPYIDVIIGGDDHFVMTKDSVVVNPLGQNSYIAQSGPFYRNLGRFTINFDKEVKSVTWQNIELNSTVSEEPNTKGLFEEMEKAIAAQWSNPVSDLITVASADFVEVRNPDYLVDSSKIFVDSPIGDLVTDAYKWKFPNADIAICPGGNTAQPLYKGNVYGIDVFRVFGAGYNTDDTLGYRMASFKISGTDLYKGIAFGLADIESDDEFFLNVAGINVFYNGGRGVSDRIIVIMKDGLPLDTSKSYTIITNEFTYYALKLIGEIYGLGIVMTDEAIYSGVAEYEVLRDYLKTFKTIKPQIANRIFIGFPDETSIENNNSKTNDLNVFPNPATSVLNFNNNNLPENCEIKIVDYSGKVVLDNHNNTSNSININSLENGEYTLIFKINNKSISKKFVVSK